MSLAFLRWTNPKKEQDIGTWRRPDYKLCAQDTPATNMSVDRAKCDNGDVK